MIQQAKIPSQKAIKNGFLHRNYEGTEELRSNRYSIRLVKTYSNSYIDMKKYL